MKIHIKFRNTSDDCLSKIKSDVEILSHFHVYDNLSKADKFLILNNIFENSFNKNCPIKSQCIALKSYYSPWLNNTLRESIREKHRLHNLSQENPEFVPLYKQRNLVSNKTSMPRRCLIELLDNVKIVIFTQSETACIKVIQC